LVERFVLTLINEDYYYYYYFSFLCSSHMPVQHIYHQLCLGPLYFFNSRPVISIGLVITYYFKP